MLSPAPSRGVFVLVAKRKHDLNRAMLDVLGWMCWAMLDVDARDVMGGGTGVHGVSLVSTIDISLHVFTSAQSSYQSTKTSSR